MVIACSQCQTRFHVDDARIPEAGIRVRCSKCKHAFFVRPPSASPEAAVHEAAEAAVEAAGESAGLPAPEPAVDLPEPVAPAAEPDLEEPPVDAAEPEPDPRDAFGESHESQPADEEDDWQFAIDPPVAAGARLGETPGEATGGAAPRSLEARDDERRSAAAEPETSSLADLESPESWDLLGDRAAPAAEPELDATAPLEELEQALHAREQEEAASLAPAPAARSTPAGAGIAAQVLGWVALLALTGLIARSLVVPGPGPAALEAGAVRVVGLEARDVRGRIVENALAGPLFVVTGSLANAGGTPVVTNRAVRVVLLDAAEHSLPGGALAGLPLPPGDVRTQEPAELRRSLEDSAARLARRAIGAGEAVPFQVVFEGLDPQAVAFRLEDAPAPTLPASAPSEGASEGASEGSGEEVDREAGGPGQADGPAASGATGSAASASS